MSDTTRRQREDEDRDEALEDTFPASDPPAVGGTTGPDAGPVAPETKTSPG